ncbi:MAG: hypothetical protein D6725_02220 [Planctomycetota bacterium]|nr:MAG: hypothetical protein D6725_02220 [Planctomycetota bacterium]
MRPTIRSGNHRPDCDLALFGFREHIRPVAADVWRPARSLVRNERPYTQRASRRVAMDRSIQCHVQTSDSPSRSDRSPQRHPAVGVNSRRPGNGEGVLSGIRRRAETLRVVVLGQDPVSADVVFQAVADVPGIEAVLVDLNDGFPAEALRFSDGAAPDLAFLDVSSAEPTPLKLIEQCRKILADVPLILLIDGDHEDTALAALHLGVDEYLLKDDLAPSQLLVGVANALTAFFRNRDLTARHNPDAAPSMAARACGEKPTQTDTSGARHQPPTFDADSAMERVAGDLELLAELVELFEEDLPGQLECAQQAVQAGDHERLYRVAHQLKNSLGNLGATRGEALALQIEKDARSGVLQSGTELVETLRREIEQFLPQLRDFVARGTPRTAAETG